MEEIWKPVIVWKNNIKYDYSGYYETNNIGIVRSLDRLDKLGHTRKGKIMKPAVNQSCYLRLGLRNGTDKQEHFFVQRIVWCSFNGAIPEGMQVNHINEIKTDNRLENLELVTCKENNNWGTRNERAAKSNKKQKGNNTNRKDLSKPVLQYTLEGELVKVWESQKEIERELGIKQAQISLCCSGRRKSAHNFVWNFKN